jgi:hypothetical protein
LHDNDHHTLLPTQLKYSGSYAWNLRGYSPDHAPSDFPLFGSLKDALEGHCFASNHELEKAAQSKALSLESMKDEFLDHLSDC